MSSINVKTMISYKDYRPVNLRNREVSGKQIENGDSEVFFIYFKNRDDSIIWQFDDVKEGRRVYRAIVRHYSKDISELLEEQASYDDFLRGQNEGQ